MLCQFQHEPHEPPSGSEEAEQTERCPGKGPGSDVRCYVMLCYVFLMLCYGELCCNMFKTVAMDSKNIQLQLCLLLLRLLLLPWPLLLLFLVLPSLVLPPPPLPPVMLPTAAAAVVAAAAAVAARLRDDDRNSPDVLSYLLAENTYTSHAMKETQQLQQQLYQEMKDRIQEADTSVAVR